MREEEIREELALGIRCFIEAEEKSKRREIDSFEELRLLETSFNRLFLAVEHLCNALVIVETGNFSQKHFGDWKKLNDLGKSYQQDFAGIYQEAYALRSYGDYRKHLHVKDRFNHETLTLQIRLIHDLFLNCLDMLKERIDLRGLEKRLP